MDRMIYRKLTWDRRRSVATAVIDLKNNFHTLTTPQTIRKRMHKIEYVGPIARKKPYGKKSNRHKRVLWTRVHLSKPRIFLN